jgi:DNA-binding XRE family transcriptional regulator
MKKWEDVRRGMYKKDPGMKRRVEKEKEKIRLALQIRQLRQRAGISQAQLARLIGTSRTAVTRMEDEGYDRYSLHTLRRVAEALDAELVVGLRKTA